MSESLKDFKARIDADLDELEASGTARAKTPVKKLGDVLIQQDLLAGMEAATSHSSKARGPASLKSIREIATGNKALAKLAKPTTHLRKILDAADAIQARPDAADIAFMARQLVQATLPHSNPTGNPPEWYRSNGNFTLSIRPGYATDPATGQRYCIGYPYGTIPRLLLFWLNTEVVRTRNQHIELGSSLADFMRQLGLDPSRGGKRSDAHRLRDQMHRLFRAQISFDETHETGQRWMDMQIAPTGEFWWDIKSPEQGVLWNSWIEVGEKFYQAILASPVPVDMRALKALRKSPLALDLYAWAVHRTYGITKKGVPQRLTWKQLQAQFGGDYTDAKNFKRKAKEALRKVAVVYPGLHFDEVDGGLILKPGRPAVIEQAKPTS